MICIAYVVSTRRAESSAVPRACVAEAVDLMDSRKGKGGNGRIALGGRARGVTVVTPTPGPNSMIGSQSALQASRRGLPWRSLRPGECEGRRIGRRTASSRPCSVAYQVPDDCRPVDEVGQGVRPGPGPRRLRLRPGIGHRVQPPCGSGYELGEMVRCPSRFPVDRCLCTAEVAPRHRALDLANLLQQLDNALMRL